MEKQKECWIWYRANPFDWEVKAVYTDSDKLVAQINEDWGLDIDYETMMDCEWQEENETKIEKSNRLI